MVKGRVLKEKSGRTVLNLLGDKFVRKALACGKEMETSLALPVTKGSGSTERQTIPAPKPFDEPEGACKSFSTGSASFQTGDICKLSVINTPGMFLQTLSRGLCPGFCISSGRTLANRNPGLKCFCYNFTVTKPLMGRLLFAPVKETDQHRLLQS